MASSSKTTTDEAAPAGEHWTAPYRRRLGINNSPVVPYNWSPPNPGQLKIVFVVQPKTINSRIVGAIALNSDMDLIGFTFAILNLYSDVAMELYALKVAAHLTEELKDRGVSDADVIYHSELGFVTAYFNEQTGGEHEAVLKQLMPHDLEGIDDRCVTVTGVDGNPLSIAMIDSVPELEQFLQKLRRDAEIGPVGMHWAGKYRSSLGIGDSNVVVYKKDSLKNDFKIVFLAVPDDGAVVLGANSTWTVGAIAVNSNLKLVGVAGGGSIKFATANAMGMQLYALRAAGNLAQKLRDKGVHIGPVVYQSGLVEGDDDSQGESEPAVLPPHDLETVDTKCLNVVGENTKKLLNQVHKLGNPALMALIDQMKKDAGVRRR